MLLLRRGEEKTRCVTGHAFNDTLTDWTTVCLWTWRWITLHWFVRYYSRNVPIYRLFYCFFLHYKILFLNIICFWFFVCFSYVLNYFSTCNVVVGHCGPTLAAVGYILLLKQETPFQRLRDTEWIYRTLLSSFYAAEELDSVERYCSSNRTVQCRGLRGVLFLWRPWLPSFITLRWFDYCKHAITVNWYRVILTR